MTYKLILIYERFHFFEFFSHKVELVWVPPTANPKINI